jgi:hypothetical protein
MEQKKFITLFGIAMFILICFMWNENQVSQVALNTAATIFLWHGLWAIADLIEEQLSDGEHSHISAMLFIPLGIICIAANKTKSNPLENVSDFVINKLGGYFY